MKDPEEALAAARRAAARADPGDGAEEVGEEAPWSLEGRAVSTRRLAEWAIIEPDETRVRSTRRWGGPLTAVKLLLVRLLRQYIGQMSAQQSRFNAHVAAHVMRLEERVAELEEAARRGRDSDPPPG
ncbi:MAG TPA: hypothetical protein VGL51_08455 [Solirubrobacteraceae bacterium]